jgi:A/G-specific adenine glycosylase
MRALTEVLRAWFAPRRHRYPWRGSTDPYSVLVSEVMLQQTQASRVAPAFERFLGQYPTLRDLALAPRDDVVRSWAGLGYNRRAVALSEMARSLVDDHRGRVPRDPELLRRLPGIGAYTAAAVASLAFGEPVAALDTNVRRVVARVWVGRDAGDVAPADLRDRAERWLDRDDPATWNQALMDLGREICRPRPRCDVCPIAFGCRFLATGALPSASRRRPGRFEGSSRQVRGAVVDALRRSGSSSLDAIARGTGFPTDRIREAVAALRRDGLVEAGPAALEGRPAGRVRLAR